MKTKCHLKCTNEEQEIISVYLKNNDSSKYNIHVPIFEIRKCNVLAHDNS